MKKHSITLSLYNCSFVTFSSTGVYINIFIIYPKKLQFAADGQFFIVIFNRLKKL